AFRHLQLLPPQAATRHARTSRPFSEHPGRSPPEVPLCGPRIRHHARALPFTNDRTGIGRSLGSDESPKRKVHQKAKNQTWPTNRRGCPTHCAFCNERESPPRPRADLAEALLRFQRKDRGEAHREAALHTP